MKNSEKRQYNLYLSDDAKKQIKILAAIYGLSYDELINTLVNEEVDKFLAHDKGAA